MRKTIMYALGIGSLICTSCQNGDTSILEVTAQPQTQSQAKSFNEVASLLTTLPMNDEIYKEVHQAVETSLNYGLDEEYRFKEILDNSENSKIVNHTKSSTSLGALIKSHISQQTKTQSVEAYNKLMELMLKSDIQIYWPYSEDWDGKTAPYITFAPDNFDQEWNYAFRRNQTGGIDTVVVNEEFMENNPVWIINNNERKYEDIPSFSKGQSISKNILYATSSSIENQVNTKSTNKENVYTVRLGRFMSSHQYDKVWSGGSEFAIQMGAIDQFKIETPEQLKQVSPKVTYIRLTRSRKDIKKRRWIDVNSILSSDWHPNENNAAFMIHEEDQGGTRHWDANLSVTIKSETYGFNAKIPYGSGDDMIYKTVYSRNFIFSTNNNVGNTFIEHTSGGVYWTIPFQIGTTIL